MTGFKPTLSAALPLLALGLAAAPARAEEVPTATPIRHLIVVVGENLSFDNLFGTFRPRSGAGVANLLSKGIVTADGSPGPNFAAAAQQRGRTGDAYQVTPARLGPYATLPRPDTTNAKGLPLGQPDLRFPADLPNGPYPITRHVGYQDYIGDPIHRFFQMWQQFDGGRMDLLTWVAETSGVTALDPADPASPTHQGALALGFYNMAAGDAPYFRELADGFALADNYHQAVMGGTGPNFFTLATGQNAFYGGTSAVPPANQIENPDPLPGSDNRYRNSSYKGGSYVNCADPAQPGVAAIRAYLAGLPYPPFRQGNCQPGRYYLVNNYDPFYTADGGVKELGPDKFVLPPQNVPTIGEALSAKGVSWKWYSGGRKAGGGTDPDTYCEVCDPLTHSTAVMTGALKRNLQSLDDLAHDLDDEARLPAVSFVIPPDPESGHPGYSTMSRYESFVRGIIARVRANPAVWRNAAVLITTDEGGGYYDSGYIQPLDFFGDGPRIVMLAVSPFARKGWIDHTYYDHVSILKFIERNWKLPPLAEASRDNLPNPLPDPADPYVPLNRPAIGDLMGLFTF